MPFSCFIYLWHRCDLLAIVSFFVCTSLAFNSLVEGDAVGSVLAWWHENWNNGESQKRSGDMLGNFESTNVSYGQTESPKHISWERAMCPAIKLAKNSVQDQRKLTNPNGRNTSSEPQWAHVRRLLGVLLKRQEEVCVEERIGGRSVLGLELAVNVRHHLSVVVVETRYDNLVEVNDDGVAVAVDVTHHAVVQWRWIRQLHRVEGRFHYLSHQIHDRCLRYRT